jgi:hypothetical protein
MPDHRTRAARAMRSRTLVVTLGALVLFAAGAWAASGGRHGPAASKATPSDGGTAARRASHSRPHAAAPRRPDIARHPPKVTGATRARFLVRDRARHVSFRCKLDRRAWRRCAKRVVYRRVSAGAHRFHVRAFNLTGKGSAAAGYRWKVVAAKQFSISPHGPPPPLYPGAAPASLPLDVHNPNSGPILVTSLAVAVANSPPGCASAENLRVRPSGASSSTPIRIAAGGTVTLPAQGVSAPTIQLVDLPVNQDACQDATFELSYHGTAHG